jgi:hypothetical protein
MLFSIPPGKFWGNNFEADHDSQHVLLIPTKALNTSFAAKDHM